MIYLYGAFFALAIAKWLDVAFLANVSWWWLIGPLLAVIAWFEVFERLFGFDAKRDLQDAAYEKAKKERIRKQMERPTVRR